MYAEVLLVRRAEAPAVSARPVELTCIGTGEQAALSTQVTDLECRPQIRTEAARAG
jgi:hypothetical protein